MSILIYKSHISNINVSTIWVYKWLLKVLKKLDQLVKTYYLRTVRKLAVFKVFGTWIKPKNKLSDIYQKPDTYVIHQKWFGHRNVEICPSPSLERNVL